jgi:hypothetical protein
MGAANDRPDDSGLFLLPLRENTSSVARRALQAESDLRPSIPAAEALIAAMLYHQHALSIA